MKVILAAVAFLLVAGGATGLAVALTRTNGSNAPVPMPQQLAALRQELPCCIPLGSNMQLRYAKPAAGSDALEFALVGALSEHAWMSWGPADPRATNRLMGSADCAAGGISDVDGKPWAADMFLSSYAPCDTSDPPSGVCPDPTINSDPKTGAKLAATPAAARALDSVQLLSGTRDGGVTAIRMRRKLAAADVLDHKIDPAAPLNYIWAHGQLSPADPSSSQKAPSLRLKQHSGSPDSYGALTALRLASCPASCPDLTPSLEKDPPPPPPPSRAAAPPAGAAPAAVLLTGGGAKVTLSAKKGATGARGVLVSFAAQKKSQWAALGVGTEMVGAVAYIAWRDAVTGTLRTGVYNLTGLEAADVKQLPPPPAKGGALAAPNGGVVASSSSPGGLLSFDAWLPLKAGQKKLPLLWALGDNWKQPPPDEAQHFARSDKATVLDVPQAAPSASPARPLIPGCALTQQFELARLGDGWCDDLYPYNTAACKYDGGDCCNPKAPQYSCRDPASPLNGKASPRGLRLPAPRNPRYTAGLGRELSTRELVTTWNNFYEFSTSKDVFQYVTPQARAAMELGDPGFKGWAITIDGMVAKPMTIDVRDLIKMFHIEERVYRHRCVEAWAIVVPWVGFPLRKLLAAVQPLPGAKYVRFETDAGSYFPNVGASMMDGGPMWPYVEGLSIPEAWNDLAFMSIGQFNGTLTSQSGAPIRINVPWKYGFKSVKSLRRISFVVDQPVNYWKAFSPQEYGFWANINPKVPHPRWSQAQEQLLVDSSTPKGYARSLPFNNYTDEVAYLYRDGLKALAATGDRTYFF